MGAAVKLPLAQGFGQTNRIDKWWLNPLWMAIALTFALVYTFLRLFFFDGQIHYDNHRVTSPIFSPDVIHLFSLNVPLWVNSAMLILWIPFGFRGTCYYMRRVYYRTFFASPPACMVSEPKIAKSLGYKGEKGLFIFNNIHRYMLYLAMIILVMKYIDVFHTLKFHLSDGEIKYGISLGTLVLALESFLLTMYVTSCHAFRHLMGGFSKRWGKGFSGIFGNLFRKVSSINIHHGFWFWTSLGMVFLGDLFVWGVSKGIISDPQFIF